MALGLIKHWNCFQGCSLPLAKLTTLSLWVRLGVHKLPQYIVVISCKAIHWLGRNSQTAVRHVLWDTYCRQNLISSCPINCSSGVALRCVALRQALQILSTILLQYRPVALPVFLHKVRFHSHFATAVVIMFSSHWIASSSASRTEKRLRDRLLALWMSTSRLCNLRSVGGHIDTGKADHTNRSA